jgi:hypothetical protein
MQEDPNDPQQVLQEQDEEETTTDTPEDQQDQGLERHMNGAETSGLNEDGEEQKLDAVGGLPSDDGDADADEDEGDAGVDHDNA